MENVDNYKVAPTYLYSDKCKEGKLFSTQDEVDSAWETGWFGPPWLNKVKPLLSESDFEEDFGTKAVLIQVAESDSRYAGIDLKPKDSIATLYEKIEEWENGMEE